MLKYILQNVDLIPQEDMRTCWLASIKMLRKWEQDRKPTPNLGELIMQISVNVTADWLALKSAPSGLNKSFIEKLAQFYKMNGRLYAHTPKKLEIERLLQLAGPLWYAGKLNGYRGNAATAGGPGGHVIVLTGLVETGDGKTMVSINDPWAPGIGSKEVLEFDQLTTQLQCWGLIHPK